MTFHGGRSRSSVRVWDVRDGGGLLVYPSPRYHIPLGTQISLPHHTHRIPYDVIASLHATNNLVIRSGKLRLVERAQKERYCEEDYCVDGGHGWVVSGSQRVCWVPPGYIGSTEVSHFWAGSSLVMVGQGGTLRVLVF